jgi:hypothetical protein
LRIAAQTCCSVRVIGTAGIHDAVQRDAIATQLIGNIVRLRFEWICTPLVGPIVVMRSVPLATRYRVRKTVGVGIEDLTDCDDNDGPLMAPPPQLDPNMITIPAKQITVVARGCIFSIRIRVTARSG